MRSSHFKINHLLVEVFQVGPVYLRNASGDIEIRPCASVDEVRHAMTPIRYYFGRSAPNEAQAERFTRVLPPERIYAAWEGSRAVGGLGAFPF